MSQRPHIVRNASSSTTSGSWSASSACAGAFDLVRDLVDQAGLRRLGPLWLGPHNATVIPQSDDAADPDGSDGASLLTLLASFLSESPS